MWKSFCPHFGAVQGRRCLPLCLFSHFVPIVPSWRAGSGNTACCVSIGAEQIGCVVNVARVMPELRLVFSGIGLSAARN